MASATFIGESVMSTTSAVSIAASEPSPPIAIPTSALAITGASLIPSPTKATFPWDLNAFKSCSIAVTLSSGNNFLS